MTEEHKVEKLLQPRIQMIAPVPEYGMKVNTIIIHDDNLMFELSPTYKLNLTGIRQYPHLYKELPWWAEREESEMPEYVKIAKEPEYVFKVIEFTQDDYCYYRGSQDGKCGDFTSRFLPATSTEYNNYINKQLKG